MHKNPIQQFTMFTTQTRERYISNNYPNYFNQSDNAKLLREEMVLFYIYRVEIMLCGVVVIALVDYLDVDGSIPAVVTYFAYSYQSIYDFNVL